MPIAFQFPIALVLSIVCLAMPTRADFQAGMDADNRKDYATALSEWRPLAKKEVAEAQYKLGMLYSMGYGVPRDFVQAYKWYSLAGANGNKNAATLRDALAKQITSYQIAEAHKLAREWMPKMP